MSENENDWNEYKNLVLQDLSELKRDMQSTLDKLDCLKESITIIKTNAKVYGAIAAFILTTVVQIAFYFIAK